MTNTFNVFIDDRPAVADMLLDCVLSSVTVLQKEHPSLDIPGLVEILKRPGCFFLKPARMSDGDFEALLLSLVIMASSEYQGIDPDDVLQATRAGST